MTMKKKKIKQTKEEPTVVQFMKHAIKTGDKMGAEIVGIRKA